MLCADARERGFGDSTTDVTTSEGGSGMGRAFRTLFSGLIIVLLSATSSMAQATAEITGTVKDSSGAVLPGANVIGTQAETGFKREAVTGVDGLFSLPALPIGPYRREVS